MDKNALETAAGYLALSDHLKGRSDARQSHDPLCRIARYQVIESKLQQTTESPGL